MSTAAPTFYFMNYKGHAGDIILSRIFIRELLAAYPDVTVVVECHEQYGYLLADLGVKVVVADTSDPNLHIVVKQTSPNLYFFDLYFLMNDKDAFLLYGISYNSFVHNYNASLKKYGLYERYKLYDKREMPFNEFPAQPHVPRVKDRAVLVENGQAFSGQSDMDLNAYLHEFAEAFPGLNFYCSAKPNFTAHNVFDISAYNLIEISEVSNACIALLTRCSGVNAAAMTLKNKYKPRCFAGATDVLMSYWLWELPENQALQLKDKEDVLEYLAMVNQYSATLPYSTADMMRNPEKYRIKLGNYVNDVSMCRFLTSSEELKGCMGYLAAERLYSHVQDCKNWELAYVLSDLSDGNVLEIGRSNFLLRTNTLLKRIPGEKYEIEAEESADKSIIVNQLVGNFPDGVNLPAGFFQNIVCLSLSEYGFDINKFAEEASRLLSAGGKLYVTFDYWETKTPEQMIFDKNDVLIMIEACKLNRLFLTEDMNWELGYTIENADYTIGMLRFIKEGRIL